jgi:hypothetical protein
LRGGGAGDMVRGKSSWEDELWSYLDIGDGINCPIYSSCRLRLKGVWCYSEHSEYCEARNEFLDDDEPDLTNPMIAQLPACPRSGRIFKLVGKLATKYQVEAGINHLPVPIDIITRAGDNLPIEVRKVPLNAYHGAVWKLSDCWLVQLNCNDTVCRQRFTLYHEIFHILAHCKSTPVFKKPTRGRQGSFNEMLADHFSGIILVPAGQVKKLWPEVRDVSQMAALFDVPKSVMYIALRGMGVIQPCHAGSNNF